MEVIRPDQVAKDVKEAAEALFEAADLRPGSLLVLGCSTSEIQGKKIGSAGSVEYAHAVLEPLLHACRAHSIYLAVQGCEHINRALVVEREAQEKYGLVEVTVLPVPHAGGATAACAMSMFKDPVVVESISAHAGIDIGDTLIGMHLRPVAVPVRIAKKRIGEANLVLARTRPKLIGGNRAVYGPVREK